MGGSVTTLLNTEGRIVPVKGDGQIKAPPPPMYIREEIPSPIWTCPSSGDNFAEFCPVTQCPANLRPRLKRIPNCAYLILKTPQLDKYRLAYIFKDDPERAEKKIARGRTKIRQALFLTRLMDNEVYTKVSKHFCPKCSVGKPTAGPCLNTKKCEARVKFAAFRLKKFPFNLPLLKMDAKRIFMLGGALAHIRTVYSPLMAKTSTPLHKLIGMRRKTLERLELLSAPSTQKE